MNDRPLTVADLAHTLQGMGWQRPAAAGIAGNVARESGPVLNPRAIGDSGQSVGLFQHHQSRAEALRRFAAERGKSWDDPLTQAQFMNHEVDTQYPDLRARLNAISNPAQAASVFMNEFERPKERAQNAAIRGQYAQQIYSTLQRLSPIQPAEAADEGMSLDDALKQFMPEEAGVEGLDLDTALEQYLGGADSLPQTDEPIPVPSPAAEPMGAIPIDPNAANTPESPMQGDGRLTRDLVGMASMAPMVGRLAGPVNTARGALLGLQQLFSRAQPQAQAPQAQAQAPQPPQAPPPSQAAPPAAPAGVRLNRVAGISKALPRRAPQPTQSKAHWSTTQTRDKLGRFSRK